ncbi:hypothetical protein SCP_0302810 [Sparassis crispa]|uniref:Uncharacterized protein n=1 Tax=Sparassis crispa TaxID=139825 RepID=A0A401GEG0_9APHY|nr:hypothetical protein SCP_0302810 [Sparassis crispa]GBE80566.1 hypothetical protein SCP_0302810 [Sparassis crispa]
MGTPPDAKITKEDVGSLHRHTLTSLAHDAVMQIQVPELHDSPSPKSDQILDLDFTVGSYYRPNNVMFDSLALMQEGAITYLRLMLQVMLAKKHSIGIEG